MLMVFLGNSKINTVYDENRGHPNTRDNRALPKKELPKRSTSGYTSIAASRQDKKHFGLLACPFPPASPSSELFEPATRPPCWLPDIALGRGQTLSYPTICRDDTQLTIFATLRRIDQPATTWGNTRRIFQFGRTQQA